MQRVKNKEILGGKNSEDAAAVGREKSLNTETRQ